MENARPQRLLTLLIACFLVQSAIFGAIVATHLDDRSVHVALLDGTGGRDAALGQGGTQGEDTPAVGAPAAAGAPQASAAAAPVRAMHTGTAVQAPVGDPGPVKASLQGITGGTIKLGTTLGITGPVPFPDVEQALSAWFQHVNDTGGIGGRRVQWIAYDDGLDANRGAANLQRLFEQDQVLAAVGSFSLGVPKAIPYLEAHRYPLVGGSGLDDGEFRSTMVWNPVPNPQSVSGIICDFMGRLYPDGKKVGIVYVDTAVTIAYNKYISQCLRDRGYGDVQSYEVSLAQPDYTGTVLQLRAAGRDTVLPLTENKSKVRLFQALDRQQYYPAIVGDLASNDPAVQAYQGRSAEGMYIPSVLRALHDPSPVIREMKAIVERYHPGASSQMTGWAEQAYVSAVMFTDAARALGPGLTRESLIAALNALHDYVPGGGDGLAPPITYGDPGRHSVTPACYQYWRKVGTSFTAPSRFLCV